MNSLVRPIVLISLVLLVPILPFLVFHDQFDAWVGRWTENPLPIPLAVAMIVGLLATDIFLPVPSSAISTMGGWQLGWVGGTLASWLGMSIGAMLGYLLARRWGRRFAIWLSGEDELARMHRMSDRYGAAVLVLTRGVPVLAEASVLLMGVHKLSWQRFVPAVLLSNLGIAFAYSAFGDYAEEKQWLPLALGVSIALPVLLATMLNRWFRPSEELQPDDRDPPTAGPERRIDDEYDIADPRLDARRHDVHEGCEEPSRKGIPDEE